MKIITVSALVVGTGAAGYNAACRLKQGGKEVAIVTEAVMDGTSLPPCFKRQAAL